MQDEKTIVAFDYIGLTVEQFTALRRQLREAGCEVQVIKNNISRRASEAAGYKELAEYLEVKEDSVYAWLKGYYDFGAKKQKRLKEILDLIKE